MSSEIWEVQSTLNSIGSKNSTQFTHSPINYTELMGNVKFQILLRDEKSHEVVAALDKTSDIHLGSPAEFTSKREQQEVILRQVFRPMLAKMFKDFYASLESINNKKSKIYIAHSNSELPTIGKNVAGSIKND